MKRIIFTSIFSLFIASTLCWSQEESVKNRKNAIKIELLTPVQQLLSDDNSRTLRINYDRYINSKLSYQLGIWLYKYGYESTYIWNFYRISEITTKSLFRSGTIQSTLKWYPFTKPHKIGGFYLGGSLGFGFQKNQYNEQRNDFLNGEWYEVSSQEINKFFYGTIGATIGGQFFFFNKRLVVEPSIVANVYIGKNLNEAEEPLSRSIESLSELLSGVFVQMGYAF
jgi:hypothetical protein